MYSYSVACSLAHYPLRMHGEQARVCKTKVGVYHGSQNTCSKTCRYALSLTNFCRAVFRDPTQPHFLGQVCHCQSFQHREQVTNKLNEKKMPALLSTLPPTNETMNINGVILLGRMSLFTLCFEYVQQSYIARERGSSRTFLLPCPPQFPPVLPKFDFNKKEQKRQENRKKPHCNFWHVAMECNKKRNPQKGLCKPNQCVQEHKNKLRCGICISIHLNH